MTNPSGELVETRWETFSDPSYYDMWCVRKAGERRFGHGFHLVNGDEAKALASALTNMEKRIGVLEAENSDLKQSVIAFAAPWAVGYARDFDLPKGHLHPTHYDILAKCGARMDDFTRATLKEGGEQR